MSERLPAASAHERLAPGGVAGLHLLVAVLLAVVAARAVAGNEGHPAAVLAGVAVMAAVYTAGSTVRRVREDRRLAVAWLAAVLAVWVALLLLTADAVWLAFPLFFMELHLLRRRWGLAAVGLTTAIAVAGFAWHQQAIVVAAVIGPVIGAGVAVVVTVGYRALYRESEYRRRLLDQLTAAQADLAAAERAAGMAAERERLAREIHDTLAQGLSSIQLLLRAAERALPGRPRDAARHVRLARQTALDNLAEARRFVQALTPPALDGGSLPAALSRLCDRTAERSGLTIAFRLAGTPAPVPTPREAALLRIAQSALANTVQHAHGSHATVTLSYTGARIVLEVSDDGAGFDPDACPAEGTRDISQGSSVSGGFGLAAMRARAQALGGTMVVESAPGRGTVLTASFAAGTGEPGGHVAASG